MKKASRSPLVFYVLGCLAQVYENVNEIIDYSNGRHLIYEGYYYAGRQIFSAILFLVGFVLSIFHYGFSGRLWLMAFLGIACVFSVGGISSKPQYAILTLSLIFVGYLTYCWRTPFKEDVF